MSAQAANPRAQMHFGACRGRHGHKGRDTQCFRVRVEPMPVHQEEAAPEVEEAAPRAKVRFVLPPPRELRDLDYEDNLVPYWPDLENRRPQRGNRLRFWLRRVWKHLCCFN